MPAKTVSIDQICIILAGQGHEPLTKMAVSNFVRDGMPKAGRGDYDPKACTHWYIGRLRTSVRRKEAESAEGEILSLDKEQTRLIKAKADNEMMTVGERRGDLIPLHVYESNMSRIVQTTKMKLLDIPARLAPKLDGLSRAESKALMLAVVKGICADLAQNRYGDKSTTPGATAIPAAAKRTRARTTRKPRAGER